MTQPTRHVVEFVETLAGPVIYLAFFGITHLAGSFACTLSSGNAPLVTDVSGVIVGTVLVLALIALTLIGLFMLKATRMIGRAEADNEDAFMGLVMLTLGILSAVAVIWTALPISTVTPAC